MEQTQRQDYFRTGRRGDLFGLAQPLDSRPKPENIRAKLHALLSAAHESEVCPWNDDRLEYHALVFPQMANWLPHEEAEQLHHEFRMAIVCFGIPYGERKVVRASPAL